MHPPAPRYTLSVVRGATFATRASPRRAPHRSQDTTGQSTRVEMALNLQRTVGNIAFRTLLQRAPTLGWDPTAENKSFKRTHHTDPNRTLKRDGVALRNVLVQGLSHGLTDKDATAAGGAAVEDTAGKAVVWMPEVLKPKD